MRCGSGRCLSMGVMLSTLYAAMWDLEGIRAAHAGLAGRAEALAEALAPARQWAGRVVRPSHVRGNGGMRRERRSPSLIGGSGCRICLDTGGMPA